MFGQIDLVPGIFDIESGLPRKNAGLVGPHHLQALEIVAAIEPAAPPEVIGVVTPRDRENIGVIGWENTARATGARDWLAVSASNRGPE